jgi:hypothetical protein
MCLTMDGLALSHADQARALVAAGAGWVQLRMKNAAPDVWLATAREVVAICHEGGVLCTINDHVEIALASDADGVHQFKLPFGFTIVHVSACVEAYASSGSTFNLDIQDDGTDVITAVTAN